MPSEEKNTIATASASGTIKFNRRHAEDVMSDEIVREHGIMMLLGTMRAEERVAAFLLDLSERYLARGRAGGEFNLCMTREEIGSYLRLKLETVSRVLSRFQESSLITVRNRYVRILDKRKLAGKTASA